MNIQSKKIWGGEVSLPSPGGKAASEKAVDPVAFGNEGVFKKGGESFDE